MGFPQREPILILLLLLGFGLPATSGAAAYDPAPAAYGELLGEHLVRRNLDGNGFETRFDYAALHADPDQTALRSALRDHFTAARPSEMKPAERYAWAVNAYNFFIIDRIVENFVDGDGDTLRSIEDIGEGNFAVFDDPWIPIEGTVHSLNSFERRFVFLDIDRSASGLPEGLDPRFHFVLVCGATGCPALWPDPLRAQTLDAQLAAATVNALRSPRQLIREGDDLRVSKVFEWYALDFDAVGGVPSFIISHVSAVWDPPPVRLLSDIDWDWSLNRP